MSVEKEYYFDCNSRTTEAKVDKKYTRHLY